MIHVPIEARCRFCIESFCCKSCREAHENKFHQDEIKRDYFLSICHMCNGMSLPYSPNHKLQDDLMKHIVDTHFPLKCNKCLKIFETQLDIEQIGKCCIVQPEPEQPPAPKENMGENIAVSLDRPTLPEIKVDFEHNEDDVLTPLTKINLHWRRKSREFTLKTTCEGQNNEVKPPPHAGMGRPTSTPVPLNVTVDSIASLQYSSIHYNSSTDSDLSPPPQSTQKPPPVPPTPKSVKKNSLQKKPKPMSQNTPLRQIMMAKSIQRAIATHGHYNRLQQRKMSFNSSSSASENSASLQRINANNNNNNDDSCAPLDLRTSPARKRGRIEDLSISSSSLEYKSLPAIADASKATSDSGVDGGGSGSGSSSTVDFKYQEMIQVIYQNEGSSSIVTNYLSCYSESATPKMTSGNMLKKTISFESPAMHEKTPDCLIPKRAKKRIYPKSDDEDEDNNNNNVCHNDTVFYTPRSTPARRLSSPDVTSRNREKLAPANIWKYVSSVVGNFVSGGGGGEGSKAKTEEVPAQRSSSSSSSESNWTSALQKPLKAAAEYFTKATQKSNDYARAQKRRHSSTDDKHCLTAPAAAASSIISPPPTYKRRRIQGRKPIRRLLSDA